MKPKKHPTLQVRSVDAKEALRLQKENNFVILDVRPEAEFKEVSLLIKSCTSISFYGTFVSNDQQIWC